MSGLRAVDDTILRFINRDLNHPVLTELMRPLAWNDYFVPALILAGALLIWKGGIRGRFFVLLAIVIISLGDMLVINTLKHALARARPFHDIPDLHVLVGRGKSSSMPSSHSSSWAAAAMLAYLYYPRTWKVMLPLALIMAFSRVYLGVHYPTDVLVGMILGAGYAAAGLIGIHWLWRRVGRAWFPEWWAKVPSLLNPPVAVSRKSTADLSSTSNPQWLRAGYVLIALILIAKLAYIASDEIQLSEDEAYQWTWSKNLALSYFSKPPMIAYTQWLGTHLWGDTEFGVRFFAPMIGALLSLLILRFIGRETHPRTAFFLLLAIYTAPLLAVGSTLMTVDPLSVLFWTAAMLAGWRAIISEPSPAKWAWVGLWTGLGFLSKYTALAHLACWAIFFGLYAPARRHLKTAGPYLAIAILLFCSLPVLIWNLQHGWITVEHVAHNARLHHEWKPTLRFFGEFTAAEFGLLNPFFFAGAFWAAVAFWRQYRHEPLVLFLFSMGAPLFLGYWLYSLRSRVFPNWIAPSVVPLFCLMAVYWHRRARWPNRWLGAGIAVGLFIVVVMHDTDLVKKISSKPLPISVDPLRRVRGWSDLANAVSVARTNLLTEGKDVFVIAAHYGIVGQISFYLPEAKAAIDSVPLVYYRTSTHPVNQYYFWPAYREQRKGQNAIYVQESDTPRPIPEDIRAEFESVQNLGMREIHYKGRVLRKVQLFACRNLL
jgi:membrane-associated phospholipid phosphatase